MEKAIRLGILLAISILFNKFAFTQAGSRIEDFSIKLVFVDPPSTMPLVQKTALKYNKDFALILQMDDGNPAVHDQVMPFFKGQQGNPGLFFTEVNPQDKQPFKMDAVHFSFAANGTDIHDFIPGFLHWDNLINLWAGEFGIVNHGLTDPPQPDKELEALRNLSYTKRKTLSATIPNGYDMNVFVVPNNDVSLIPYAKTKHLVVYYDGINALTNPQQVETLPSIQGIEVSRGAITGNLFQEVQSIAAQAGPDNHYIATFFNHGFGGVDISFDTFKVQMNQIATVFGQDGLDNIWSASSSEVWEYLRLKELITVHSQLDGNELTITFSGNNIPDDFRYYALTLLIEGESNIVDMVVMQPDNISTYRYTQNKALLNLKWLGRVLHPLDAIATDAVIQAEQQITPTHALMAMDYVMMLPEGDVKENLRERLCALPGITYEPGFCKHTAFLGPDQEVCQGDIVILTAPDAISYIWSTGETTQTIQFEAEESVSIWAQATYEHGVIMSDTVFIQVNPLPNVQVFPKQSIVAPETEVTLSAEGASTYLWSTGDTSSTIIVSPSITTLYWVQGTDDKGCSDSDEAIIEIITDIIIDFEATTACLGDTTYLFAIVESNDLIAAIEWDMHATGQFNDASGDTASIVFNSPGEHLVGMRVTTVNGHIETVYNPVLVGGYPIIDFEYDHLCLGDQTMFTGNVMIDGGEISSLIWETGDGNQYAGPSITYQYDAVGSYNVSLIAQSTIGCTDTLTKIIHINPKPDIDLRLNDNTHISEGQVVELVPDKELIFKVVSRYDDIIWINSITTETFLVTKAGTYWVNVTLDGCSSTRNFSVTKQEDIPVAIEGLMNLFTPNGDGYNDYWVIKDLEKIRPVRVAVYTRSGLLVYQNSDYQNDWDGYYSGNPLPEGTYYYVVQDTHGQITKGPLTIIR